MTGAADELDEATAGLAVTGFATGVLVLADADAPVPTGTGLFACRFAGLDAPRPAVPRYGMDVVGVVDVDRAPAGAEPDRAPFVEARGVGTSFRAILFCPTSFELEALRFRADASEEPFGGGTGR